MAEQKPDAADTDAKKPYEPKGGEDEGSASHDGHDEHLKEDQKPTTK
jgi:hypothetical protein